MRLGEHSNSMSKPHAAAVKQHPDTSALLLAGCKLLSHAELQKLEAERI